MKIKPQTAILLVLAIFIAGITATSAAGVWTTKTTKTPAKLTGPQYSDTYDPADIRGSYTFSDISNFYQIPLEDLAAAFGVEESRAAAFKCKDLESIYENELYEVGTASVRLFAAYYLGLSYSSAEETYLPDTAAEILIKKGALTQEQRAYLESHTIPAS